MNKADNFNCLLSATHHKLLLQTNGCLIVGSLYNMTKKKKTDEELQYEYGYCTIFRFTAPNIKMHLYVLMPPFLCYLITYICQEQCRKQNHHHKDMLTTNLCHTTNLTNGLSCLPWQDERN